MNWTEKLKQAMLESGDTSQIEWCTMTNDEMEHAGNVHFNAWSRNYVYYPIYNGLTPYVGCIQRNPVVV